MRRAINVLSCVSTLTLHSAFSSFHIGHQQTFKAMVRITRSTSLAASTNKRTVSSTVTPQKKRTRTKLLKKLDVKNDSDTTPIPCCTDRRILFSLSENDDDPIIHATLVARPSRRNRSPYVADIFLQHEQREAICHVPNLDMGGKCIAGVTLLVKMARDRQGRPVGSDAVSSKFGTPKCEFIAQLLLVDESAWHPTWYPPVWVGAHPSLGERIALTWLTKNLLSGVLPEIQHVESQVRNPCGADNIRSDFCVTHSDGSKRIIEVKTVVDTDYSVEAMPITTAPEMTNEKTKSKAKRPRCIFTSDRIPYTRTAIFPWGNSNQKGPDGEKVVSARAIHHVRELTRIARGELRDTETSEQYAATILLVVIRNDAQSFRPNTEACPSFTRYLQEAKEGGVQVVAKAVEWNEQGVCYDTDGCLPIEWSSNMEK